ncbi:hypothetical protein V5O48_011493 [Marasmius crinis-equi]|uniref:Cytochrome P450 n=1 Tax=Marasmius crinis-equi TaxID=585013 RepID=A0ABR3F5I8_9AGAR
MSFESVTPLHLSVFVAAVGVLLYRMRRSKNAAVADIRGPKSPSFLIGNFGELIRGQAGEMDFKWHSQFGNVVRFKAPFGEDRLLISDPKAAGHILQGYTWGSPPEQRSRSLFFTGNDVGYAQGDDHKRHRRVMNPAFGPSAAKNLVPVFYLAASSLTTKWKDLLSMSKDESDVLDIPQWMSRATLDGIGHAAFDYDLGAMENQDNRLVAAYDNLLQLIIDSLSALIPHKMMAWIYERLSAFSHPLARVRVARNVGREVARELVSEKTKEIVGGHGSHLKDVMSLLLKANMSPQNEKSRLDEDEMFAEMLAILFAGHDTTANSLSWMLLELARHPEVQNKLRREIHDKERQLVSEGRAGFAAEDFESLPYLNAFMKESMRYNPASIRINKVANADDCIPLSESIKTASGKEIKEIPVYKGQKVFISIGGYNRNKAVFGEDAHMFRPERWLEKEKSESQLTSVGVYANLLTFSGGTRSCVGWRFA